MHRGGRLRRRALPLAVGADQGDRPLHVRPVAVVVHRLSRRHVQAAGVERVVRVRLGSAAPLRLPVHAEHLPDGPLRVPRRLVLHVAVVGEAVLRGDQVVLAAPPDVVAAVLERPEQHRLVGTQHVEHGAVAAHVGVPGAHERAAAGRADRVLHERAAEAHRVAAHPLVQVRRARGGVAHVPQHVAAPGIGIDDDDVGALHTRAPWAPRTHTYTYTCDDSARATAW